MTKLNSYESNFLYRLSKFKEKCIDTTTDYV